MKRRIVAWLAIAGIAFNALWPLVANAAPVDIPTSICTTNKASQAAQQSPAKHIPASSSLPHCPFCLGVSDHAPGLAQSASPVIVVAPAGFHLPLYVTPVRASFTYPSARPRGPPSPAL